MQVANKSIDFALFGMEKWITKGNWEHGFGTMFLGFRDAMQKYYLRLTGQVIRQVAVHLNVTPMRTAQNALHVYIKEKRRADRAIPLVLQAIDKKVQDVANYIMIDVNEFMGNFSTMQRHKFILQLQQGLSVPVFYYTWTWGGSKAGINPHIIWRVPPESEKEKRDEGMSESQKNIDFLHKNTAIYHTRAERTAYLAAVVNKNLVNSAAAAQAI
jgi:hypothetical protein